MTRPHKFIISAIHWQSVLNWRPNMSVRQSVTASVLIVPLVLACAPPLGASKAVLSARQENGVTNNRHSAASGPTLPFAQGRHFETLDDYLAFRRERGATDVPWYREIRPGVYELAGRRGPGAAPRIYTREQLMERFGFTR